MRVATYNLWNNDILFEERIGAISEAVAKIDADIVCFQEVRREENRNIINIIADYAHFPFVMFFEYPDCPDEGLAIVSKKPFINSSAIWETQVKTTNFCAVKASFEYKGKTIEVANVHLNWRNEEIRKEQINEINRWLNNEGNIEKYGIMCGDFNDVPRSDVHNLLKAYGWQDVVELSKPIDENYYSTFDLEDNPYLEKDTRPKAKIRFDWIMVNSFYIDTHIHAESVNIFGDKYSSSNIFPSDHYGVYVDID